MKTSNMVIAATLFFTACGEKKNTKEVAEDRPLQGQTLPGKKVINENLEKWASFYRTENPAFSFDRFVLRDSSTITYRPSNVRGNFERNFNGVYERFLIYSPDRTKYLDFDSYHWIPDGRGNPGFEADQQLVLVHIPTQNVRQLAFFGPSFTIEDAFWEGDSAAVALGNTYEKVPFYIRYNFSRNMQYSYSYPDTLKVKKRYTDERLKLKGIGGK